MNWDVMRISKELARNHLRFRLAVLSKLIIKIFVKANHRFSEFLHGFARFFRLEGARDIAFDRRHRWTQKMAWLTHSGVRCWKTVIVEFRQLWSRRNFVGKYFFPSFFAIYWDSLMKIDYLNKSKTYQKFFLRSFLSGMDNETGIPCPETRNPRFWIPCYTNLSGSWDWDSDSWDSSGTLSFGTQVPQTKIIWNGGPVSYSFLILTA